MTRYQLSKLTGVSEGGLSRFMSGDRDMNLRTLDKIAAAIGVTLVVTSPTRRE